MPVEDVRRADTYDEWLDAVRRDTQVTISFKTFAPMCFTQQR